MKILITGINGFVGSHLAEYCLKLDHNVFGLVRHRSDLSNIRPILDKVKLYEGTITDSASVDRAVREVKPDRVFHLAAQSYVPYSWIAPQETMSANVLGTVNVLEALRNFVPKAYVMLAGTSEEYGKWDYPYGLKYDEASGKMLRSDGQEWGITEDAPLKPLSVYGVSKVATDLLGLQYFRSYGLHVVRTRAFNHEGPRRGKEFVTATFVRQALMLKKGGIKCILVGNLDAIRDFTDVRDIVHAYWLALQCGIEGEVYNICSGKGIKIDKLLGLVLEEVLGAKEAEKVDIEMDEKRMRPADVPILIGNCDKFKEVSGWEREIPFSQTIIDMVDWEERCLNKGF